MLALESKFVSTAYKFGVIYCAKGQRTEAEMLNNTTFSDDFQEFLDFLGQKIILEVYYTPPFFFFPFFPSLLPRDETH